MKPTEPIVRRKLSDEVFDRLRAMMEAGDLTVGDEMPSERELMDRFGVGRPAIREAMQALASKGLIAISHGERARVVQPTAHAILQQMDLPFKLMIAASAQTLEDLKNARIFFERGMAREAALKATEEDKQELRFCLKRQEESLGNAEAFIEADMRLHTRLASISRNPIFTAVSEAILGWLRAYHSHVLIWTGKENLTLAEHAEIIEAVEKGDPDWAERAMVQHLERSRAVYALRQDENVA
ncbi:transcriptional regulator, GntR family [Rhizobium sp. RU20A]|uniref:transcriptional regulator NanR n=1 Tax=Rhizobium sp. RU20A TaxID=1907412 RepID=UPI000956F106|nr:transcriptional regulator NanR [Rhizobium sp. RU20A]SIR24040.1 transcriptional regulator, GntR family [Rhizobium sp. RU20A]